MAEIIVPVNGGMFDSTEIVESDGGFPRGNKAVDSAFFAKMISCFYRDGVLGEDSFVPTAGGGLSLKISGGVAWIRGYMAWQKSNTAITLAAGSSYTVVLRVDVTAGEFKLIATTDAGFEPANSENIADLVLAEVTIPAGATTLDSDMITDTRGDAAKCGYVTCSVDALAVVDTAQNANMLGGAAADAYLRKSGGAMSGSLRASADTSGMSVVRNIGYGTVLPDSLADGEVFILLA